LQGIIKSSQALGLQMLVKLGVCIQALGLQMLVKLGVCIQAFSIQGPSETTL